ncbi:MAG TPA: thioredoxin domain-containing protein [Acidobacteriaceae bacterium]|nr:thioredoxin domain-containing protein [Acidobacteriaceae bacterium]
MIRPLVLCLLVALGAGCKAQNAAPAAPIPLTPQLHRRIEVLVRSQFEVPPNVDVTIGTISKSEFPGYQTLPITFSGKGQSSTVNFLLSNDGNTVARLEKFDISHSPMEMITTEGRPIRGAPGAKVTIVNFDDLECPYCAQMHAELFPATADRYKGLVKFVYKDFPLVEIHPWAMHAAVDANCLAEQNGQAYWNFVDYVHTHASEITGAAHDAKLSEQTLDKLVHEEGQRSGLDLGKLDRCTAKQDESAVRASMKQGDALGVNGTPTMFINGERISGVLPPSLLWTAIDRALRSAGVQPPQTAETPANAGGKAAEAAPGK